MKRPLRCALLVGGFLVLWGALQFIFGLALILSTAVDPALAGRWDVVGSGRVPAIPGTPLGAAGAAGQLLSLLLAISLMKRWAGWPSIAQLGLARRLGWRDELLTGLLLGPLLMAVVFLVERAFGWATSEPGGLSAVQLAFVTLTLAFAGIVEELLLRGYVLQSLERFWPTPVAAFASSVLFALLHLGNPNISALALAGLAAAGLLFAYAYVTTRGLWLPIGLHLSWNLAEGPLLGFPVSGFSGEALVSTRVNGPDLITGGAFGPEGGLVVLLAIGLGFVALRLWGAQARSHLCSA